MRIGCSGRLAERTGIGVVQKHLYAYLSAAGHELVLSEPRDVGKSPMQKISGLAKGLCPARGPVDVYLSAVPPLPFGVRVPMLTLVHDLRWLRTRSKAGAAYRAWDLRRTVRHSDGLLCVSETTRLDLVGFAREAAGKATVQWLGTGLVPEGSFRQSHSGLLMLVGGATHKRNELAANVLATTRPPWIQGIIGVGVSQQVRDSLSEVFPCEWFSAVSDTEILRLYQRAEYFLMLGTDEGFGLPFVEAFKAGCQVIATDHPLAREIVGTAGLLIDSRDPAEIGKQLLSPPSVPVEVRINHADNFSWKAFGQKCEAELLEIAGRRS